MLTMLDAFASTRLSAGDRLGVGRALLRSTLRVAVAAQLLRR